LLASLAGWNTAACFAQPPTGPATLEGLLNADEGQKPAAPTAPADADPKRPAGTVARPKDGVQHPDLDKAWAEYEQTISKVAESVMAAINKQFDAAAAKGDLDAAEKWQAIGERFEKAGEIPVDTDAKAAVSAAFADYKKAKKELAKAYEPVVKALTKEKKIAEAKAAREELRAIDASRQDMGSSEERDGVSSAYPRSGQPVQHPNRKPHRTVLHSGPLKKSVIPYIGEKQFENGKLREAWAGKFGQWIDLSRVNETIQESKVPGGHVQYQHGKLREVHDANHGEWIDLSVIGDEIQESHAPGGGHIQYQNGRLREFHEGHFGEWMTIREQVRAR
jgi:hypothetical protein